MKETDCLYPNFLRMELKQMEGENEAENEALGALSTTIQKFINSTEMNSKVIAAEIECLSAYEDLVSEMVAANYEEIEDNHTLYESIGSEILDGKTIFNEMENVMKYKNICSQREEEYRKLKKECQQKGFSGWEAQYMHWGYLEGKMHFLVEEYQKRYNVLQKKEAQYDEIELRTKTLFQDVAEVRQMIRRAMETFSEPGEYQIKPFINGKTWREEFYDYHRRKLFTVNSEREETINWFNVKQTINKPAENISNIEYELLAECYLNADTDGMAVIIRALFKAEKKLIFQNVQISDNERINKTEIKSEYVDIWQIDEKKIFKILHYGNQTYEEKINRLRKEKESDDAQIKELIQRITLLNILNSDEGIYGNPQEGLQILRTEKDILELQYIKVCKSDIFTQCNAKMFICKPENGNKALGRQIDILDVRLTKEFADNDFFEESLKFFSGEAINKLMDLVGIREEQKLAINYATTLVKSEIEAQNNKKFINNEISDIRQCAAYIYFDCYINYAFYEENGQYQFTMYAYEGKDTEKKINEFNKDINLTSKIGQNLTKSFLDDRAEEVWNALYGK